MQVTKTLIQFSAASSHVNENNNDYK